MVERRYKLTKVAAGDYLLPGNDGATVYRLTKYIDGPGAGLDLPRDREFWAVWRWRDGGIYIDTHDLSWHRWAMVSQMHETRADAIQAALSR